MEPGIDVPVVCHQCQKPLCAEACPEKAIVRNERSGAVIVDEERCLGCGDCVEACPFGAITWHPDVKIPIICDLCDGQPKCVRYCFTKALSLSSEESMSKKKRREWARELVEKDIEKLGLTILY
jgi:Fe-S-cluster-containing hydrogenase component 2